MRSNMIAAVLRTGVCGVTETRSYTGSVICRELKILDSGSIPGIAEDQNIAVDGVKFAV